MQKNKSIVLFRLVCVLAIVFLFGVIRTYESQLFFDPFLDYFKFDNNLELPKVDFLQLSFGLLCRYFLNTILSLLVLFIIFLDFEMLKFSAFIYSCFFIVLLFSLYYCLEINENPNKITIFYIRRFLIQPILLLLFIPAFFFQKQKN
jgi:exosortase F-associated protein